MTAKQTTYLMDGDIILNGVPVFAMILKQSTDFFKISQEEIILRHSMKNS